MSSMSSRASSVASLRLPHIPQGAAGMLSLQGRATLTPQPAQRGMGLPEFGQKVAAESRVLSRNSSMMSSASEPQIREQAEQLEYSLKERIQSTGALALKILFKNNNPDGKPLANRSVLLVILTKFLRRLITAKQLRLLLQRLHLSDRSVISFEDLHGALREPDSSTALTLPRVLTLLRGGARSRFLECVEGLKTASHSSDWISSYELRKTLDKLKLHLMEPEFQRLWKRVDLDGVGAVKLDVLLKKLGVERRCEHHDSHQSNTLSSSAKDQEIKPTDRELSKLEEERRASISIEMWMKDRFRAGLHKMKVEFDKRDPDGCGKVSNEDFLQVLATFDLRLRREHFGLFLSRCGLTFRKDGVDYIHFLRTFQDRSQEGVTHRILTNPKHRFHSEESLSHASSVTAVEAKLTRLFQSDYLSLLETFQNIDKLKKGTISKEEFRAAVESRLGLEISDQEFKQLADRLPLDRLGNVQYGVYMAAFDTRRGVPSLFESNNPTVHSENGLIEGEHQRTREQERSVSELSRLIRAIVTQQYRDVVREFEELDEKNTRRLTQEDMYQLLKRLSVHPEVTRGEVRCLWSSLLTRQDGTLEFQHFLRHFGPSPKSCRFPNAKRCPPVRGDPDRMRLSNTLSYVSDILVDTLRAKAELSLSELWSEFSALDTVGTGFVSREEFKEVLTSLCAQLSQYECEVLANKFDINHDGSVAYREFLKPFASREHTWRHGSNMAAALQSHRESEEDSPRNRETVLLENLSAKIRKKLHQKRRAIVRSCQRLDASGSGQLSASELATVLQLCEVCENQDELVSVFSLLPTLPSGRLDYRPLLQKTPSTPENNQQNPQHQNTQRNI